jgi:ribosomal-protein-alanine N-acetyltransferase
MEEEKVFKVYLRAFEIDDYKLTHKWRCDDEIQFLLGGNKYFVSQEVEKKWIEGKILNNKDELYLAICLKQDNSMIGYIGVKDFDRLNRNALLQGMIIGEEQNRNLINSTQALFLILDHLFSEMGLHRVYGYWLEEHKSSILFGEMLGFQKDGLLRETVFKNNRFHNLILASVLESDFIKVRERFKK